MSDKYKEAIEEINKGNHSKAIEIYNEIYKLNNDYKALFDSVVLRFCQGTTDDNIINDIKILIKKQKNNKNQLYFMLANIHTVRRDSNEAKYYLQYCIDKKIGLRKDLIHMLAEFLVDDASVESLNQALKYVEEIQAEDKSDSTVYYLKIEALIRLNELELADKVLDDIILRFPNEDGTTYYINYLKLKTATSDQELYDLIPKYQKHIENRPNDYKSVMDLLEIYCRLDMANEAIDLLNNKCAKFIDEEYIVNEKIEILFNAKRYDEMHKVANDFLGKDYTNANININYGTKLYLLSKLEKDQNLKKELLYRALMNAENGRFIIDKGQYYYLYFNVLLDLKDYDLIIKKAKSILNSDSNDYSNMGMFYLKKALYLGRKSYDEAVENYKFLKEKNIFDYIFSGLALAKDNKEYLNILKSFPIKNYKKWNPKIRQVFGNMYLEGCYFKKNTKLGLKFISYKSSNEDPGYLALLGRFFEINLAEYEKALELYKAASELIDLRDLAYDYQLEKAYYIAGLITIDKSEKAIKKAIDELKKYDSAAPLIVSPNIRLIVAYCALKGYINEDIESLIEELKNSTLFSRYSISKEVLIKQLSKKINKEYVEFDQNIQIAYSHDSSFAREYYDYHKEDEYYFPTFNPIL